MMPPVYFVWICVFIAAIMCTCACTPLSFFCCSDRPVWCCPVHQVEASSCLALPDPSSWLAHCICCVSPAGCPADISCGNCKFYLEFSGHTTQNLFSSLTAFYPPAAAGYVLLAIALPLLGGAPYFLLPTTQQDVSELSGGKVNRTLKCCGPVAGPIDADHQHLNRKLHLRPPIIMFRCCHIISTLDDSSHSLP